MSLGEEECPVERLSPSLPTVITDSVLPAPTTKPCFPKSGSTVNQTHSPFPTRTQDEDSANTWSRINQSSKGQSHSVGESSQQAELTLRASAFTHNPSNIQPEQADEVVDQIKKLHEHGKQTMKAILSTLKGNSSPNSVQPPLTEAVITKMVQEQVAIMLMNITTQAQNYEVVDEQIQSNEGTNTIPAPEDTSKAIVLYNPWNVSQVVGVDQQGKRRRDDEDLNQGDKEPTSQHKKPYSRRARKRGRCSYHRAGICPVLEYCQEGGYYTRYCNKHGAMVVQTPQPQPRARTCYGCKRPGHLVKDCPQVKQWAEERTQE